APRGGLGPAVLRAPYPVTQSVTGKRPNLVLSNTFRCGNRARRLRSAGAQCRVCPWSARSWPTLLPDVSEPWANSTRARSGWRASWRWPSRYSCCVIGRTEMERRAIAVSMLAVGVAGCGSTPTNPSTFQVFTVQLLPSNEVPPITNGENTGKGTAVITVHSDTNTVDFSISLSGFPANTILTAAHIHPGAAGTNGGPQIGVPGH